jgi:kynurenine formamidase
VLRACLASNARWTLLGSHITVLRRAILMRCATFSCTRDGIAGRGVLLDIPRLRGTAFVDPQQPVTSAELAEAERSQGVLVAEGDILLISVGRDAHRAAHPPEPGKLPMLAGLSPNTIEWLHERKVAVLGSDAVHDPRPAHPAIDDWPIPVHMCGLAAMGLHLLDNLYLVDLEQACAGAGRWEFFIVVAPLRIEKGTGSPVNPIVIL